MSEPERICYYRGHDIDTLTLEECRLAYKAACRQLEQLRTQGQQDREMEQLFAETRKALKTGCR